MTKAATTEELAGLHKKVAESLVEDLSLETPAIEDGDDADTKKAKLALAELAIKARHDARTHAIAFLKNNNITAAAGNKEMDALKQALAAKRSARAPGQIDPRALDEAAELAATRLQ